MVGQYIEELYYDNAPQNDLIDNEDEVYEDIIFLISEFYKSLKDLNNGVVMVNIFYQITCQ